MAHCLVTGASGFIGQHLVRVLGERGHDVTCLVREGSHAPALANGDGTCRVVRGDVRDAASLRIAVEGADVVFHLAGCTRAFSYRRLAQVNVDGPRNIAQACAGCASTPVLVLVSSLAAGGPSAMDMPRTEIDADQPVSNYGRSKLAGEQAAAALANDLPLSIVRPPAVFGPGDRDGQVLLESIRRTGLHIVPGKRDLPMSLIHVDDLCRALLLVAAEGARVCNSANGPENAGSRQGLYYVADPEVVSYGQMGQLAADALGIRLRTLRVRKGWFWLPALGGEIAGRLSARPSLMNLDKLREVRAAGWVCSPARIEAELGFRPAMSLAQWYGRVVRSEE